MKKIIFSLLTLLSSISAFAQGWVGDKVQAGTDYYIYNVETGHYIHCGNDWGTRASFDTPGLIFTTAASNSGYTLSSTKNGTVNNVNCNGKFLGVDGFIDQKATVWTLTNVGTDDDPIYTMKNASGKFLYKGGNTSVITCDANADVTKDAARWKFISKARREALTDEATSTNPIDVSYYIKDAGFINNSSYDRPRHFTWPGNLTYNYDEAEVYHTAFDTYQELDVPNGKYEVEIQGFCRRDKGGTMAYLYANDEKADMLPRTDDTNSMAAAQTVFAAGKYWGTKVTVWVTTGKLKVGLKTTDTNSWVIFDNMKLTYYGSGLDEIKAELTEKINTASEMLSKPMNAAVKAALTTAITNAQNAPETFEGINEANTALTTAMSNAQTSIDIYVQIAAVNEKAATYDADGQAAYSPALTKYNNGEFTTLAEAQEILRTATIAQTTPGSDFTGALINPNFDGNINGWTDTFKGNLNHGFQSNSTYGPIKEFMECWAGSWVNSATPYKLPNGRLYQTIQNLPAGEYTLSADIIATQQFAGQDGYIASLDEVTGVYIFAESDVLFKSPACNAKAELPEHKSFTFNTTGGDTKVGLLIENTNCNWAVMDNVTLVYNGASTINLQQEALKEALASAPDTDELICNKDIKDSLAAVIAEATPISEKDGLSDEAYGEAYRKLNDAITAVNTSVEKYANTLAAINNKKTVADKIGITEQYLDAVKAIQAQYDNRTLNSDLSADVNNIIPAIINASDKSYAVFSAPEDDKEFFIQNVATGLFLGGAHAWGTQASIIKHGIPFTVAKISDGVYTLDSHTYNDAAKHFFNGTYVDGVATNVTVENLGGNVFALKVDGKYVAANAETEIVVNDEDNANGTAAQWKFVSYDDRLDNMKAEFTAKNSADATWLINCANVSRNLSLSNGQTAWENKGEQGGDNTNVVTEKYHAAFNTHQTIVVPNGTYTLTAQGFYRPDEGSAAAAFLYAGDKAVELKVKEGTGVPNNITDVSKSFSGGNYVNTIENIVVTDNKLTIGIKTEDANNWVIWDNFELTATSTPDIRDSYAATKEGYLQIGDRLLKVGAAEATEGGVTSSKLEAAIVTATTNKMGVTTILVDGGKYLMWNGEKVYVDGRTLPAKATHKPFWTIGENTITNTQTGKFLGATETAATLVDEAATAKIIEITYATDAQKAQLTAAITDAEQNHTVGFLKGQFAPYTNVKAVSTLAAVKAIDLTRKVDVEIVTEALSSLDGIKDKWIANTAEMNAVYDGTFASAENNGAPAGWTMSNNTIGGNLHSRAYVGDERLSEFNDTKSGLFLRFDGTNSDRGSMYYYGNTAGYTMPLESTTTYFVCAEFAGWGSTGKPLRLNVNGPDVANGITINTDRKADTSDDAPQFFYFEFTTQAAGNYTINFQTPGADTNKHNVVVSNVRIFTKKAGDVNADGAADILDAEALADHLTGKAETKNPDFNADKKVSLSDLTELINTLTTTANK